jgi:hypothetical protein
MRANGDELLEVVRRELEAILKGGRRITGVTFTSVGADRCRPPTVVRVSMNVMRGRGRDGRALGAGRASRAVRINGTETAGEITTFVVDRCRQQLSVGRGVASGDRSGMESEAVLEHAVRLRGFDHQPTATSTTCSPARFKARRAEVVMHPNDLSLLAEVPETARFFGIKAPVPPNPDRLVREGDAITVGGLSLGVLETPGHTPGSISLRLDEAVFVGDTLFAGSVGRTDLTGGSLECCPPIHGKRLCFDRTVVRGHGPATSIGAERRDNPFLQSGGG